MNLEVLLSILNLDISNLDKMNIKSNCTVINQCEKKDYQEYKNFKIYSYDEIGTAKSRNRGLEKIQGDIIALCDDDVIYNDDYEKIIIDEFKKNKKADIIVFNLDSPGRFQKPNKKEKKLHFYNILKYSSPRIVFRKESIKKNNITFNNMFGPGSKYLSGEDTLFLVDSYKSKLKIYASTKNIGIVNNQQSTWFKGYNEKYFFDKGALFTAINKKWRYLLMFQYLLRHKQVLKNIKFKKAFKLMIDGSNDYLLNKNR